MRRNSVRDTALAMSTTALLLLATGGALALHADVALAQSPPASNESAQQRTADDQAESAAAQQAVSNELQQTENLEFQTLNEERPPSFQQPEP
jgi:hypothetical protein